jgi:tRNA U34 2-thiouridine synthase MnmA/TrmU
LEPRRKKDGSTVRAVALVSGGLDSTLAAKVIKNQGIDVTLLHFHTGFDLSDHRRELDPLRGQEPPRNETLRAAEDLGLPVEFIDVSEEYIDIVINPRHGYGKAANPCVDCHIMMLTKAKAYIEENGFDFIVTGEVMGQRPMTQHKQTLGMVANRSGTKDVLVRPLSAKLLPETLVEREGLVAREALHGFSGRGRKAQMALAEELGITDYPQPAGGCCFLTDHNYARRFRDLMDHKPRGSVTADDLDMLKVGRHFRISDTAKAVVGRDKAENEYLEKYTGGRWTFLVHGFEGPLTLCEGEPGEEEIRYAAALTARYSGGKSEPELRVKLKGPGGDEEEITVAPLEEDLVEKWRL